MAKFKKLMLIAYDDEPNGLLPWKDCFHVEMNIDSESQDDFLKDTKPGLVCLFHHLERRNNA